MRRSTSLRRLRAFLAACCVTGSAAIAHVAAHGSIPDLVALLPVVAVVTLIVLALPIRRLGLPVILGLLGASQLAIHLLSTYLADGVHHHGGTHDGWLMLAAHTGATVVTALVLAHGEKLWWRLVGWFARRHVRYVAAPVVSLGPATPSVDLDRPVWNHFVCGAVSRRGPPLMAV